MIAPEYFNNHIAVEGEIIVKRVPNDTGSVLVWNSTTKKISTRTHADIIADLSLMTTNTNQIVTGLKSFITSGGNYAPFNNSLQIYSDDGSSPSMTYSKGGAYVGQTMFDETGFHFKNGDNNAYYNVRAKGFIKENGDNTSVLLDGGGSKPISEFVSTNHTHTSLYNNQNNDTVDSHTLLDDNKFKFVHRISAGSSNLFPTSNNANSIVAIATHPGGYGSLLGINSDNEYFSKHISAGNYSSTWRQFAYRDWVSSQLSSYVNQSQLDNRIPYTGANQNPDFNGKNLGGINRLTTNGSIKHNGLGLSLVNISGSGGYSSVLIKTGMVSGNMGTFTVKLYTYAHEYFEFNVNNYKYNNSNYATNITWKAGNSKAITRIEFLKDSNNTLYVNVVMYMAYPRVAVTDLMVYGWDDVPFDSFNWSAEFNGDITGLINEGQAIASNFLRDNYLSDSLSNYVAKSGDTMTGNLTVPNLILSSNSLLSNTLNGSQVLATVGDTMYLGNTTGLNFLNFQSTYGITHYQNGVPGQIWTSHNFNPDSKIPTSHPVYNITAQNILDWSSYLGYKDDRLIYPDEISTTKLQYGFTSWNNDGGAIPTWGDFLHFGGYPDTSGGNQNLVVFKKNGFGLRQWQGTSQSPAHYQSFVDYWHTGNLSKDEFVNLGSGKASIDITGTDLNNLRQTGFFKGSNLTNSPTGLDEWFFVTVEYHDNGWASQTATAYGTNTSTQAGRTFKRSYTGGNTWSSWYEFHTSLTFNPDNKITQQGANYRLHWDGVSDNWYRNDVLLGYMLTSFNISNFGFITNNYLISQLNNYIPTSQKGQPNGVATLDNSGLVPASQLPSYVDDVLEFVNLSSFPLTGETGKIYVATDTNQTYRWSGTTYIQIASGAVQSVNNQVGIVNLTKSDIGLGNVDNTADSIKNVAYAVTSGNSNNSANLGGIAAADYVTRTTDQIVDGKKTFNAYFDAYTPDGLFDPNARTLKVNTPSSQKILFGYRDYGGGQYYPRMGFTSDSSLTKWSVGPLGNDFVIGINNDGVETFKIRPSGATSKTQNQTQIFDKVYQGSYPDGSHPTGILVLKMPQASPDQVMFSIDINIYGYESQYLGKINVAFYKYVSGLIINNGAKAIFNTTENFPTNLARVGIGSDGLVSILIGQPDTFWNSYISFEVERVQTHYGNYTQDWSNGWSHTMESDISQYGSNIITLPTDVVATKGWVNQVTNNFQNQLNNHTHRSLYSPITGTVDINNLMEDYTMRFDTVVSPASTNGFPNMVDNANAVLSISSHPNYGVQLGTNTFGEIYTRRLQNGSWSANWSKIMTEGDLSNFVTIHTPQTIIGDKRFAVQPVKSDEGFQNTVFKVGQRNRIWSFANADSWGLSYYQGGGLSSFMGEGIGFHFGDVTDYKVYIHDSGKLFTRSTISVISPDSVGNGSIGNIGDNYKLILGNGNNGNATTRPNYGTAFWVEGSGDGYIQQQRFDGVNHAYSLRLQPYGGLLYYGDNEVATINLFQNYYTKNESLGLFVGLNGVQTIYDTKTFNVSPVVPNGSIGSHAVNLNQLNNHLPTQNWGGHQAIGDRRTIGEIAWKNYGNGHTIFDMSSGTTPWGTSKSNQDAEVPWSPAHPVLMGGNGSNTFGVRVDSARVADGISGYNLSNFVRIDIPQTIIARKVITGGTDNSYVGAALEIKGNGSTVIPGISFHQPGVVASQIRMDSSGQICIVDNPGSSYENFRAKVITGESFTSTIHGNSSQWVQAYNWGNHASAGYATQNWVSQNYMPTSHIANIITNTNILQWNDIFYYGLRLNNIFSSNTGSGLMIADDYFGNESGLVDAHHENFVAGKQKDYYKYGSLIYDNWDGLNYHIDTHLFSIGKEVTNKEDKVQVAGNISVDTINVFGDYNQLILNPLYDIKGDVRDSRNAHIYIVTRETVRLPSNPILGQRIEIFNDSENEIEVMHDNVGTLFYLPRFGKITGIAGGKGFIFDEKPIPAKHYGI